MNQPPKLVWISIIGNVASPVFGICAYAIWNPGTRNHLLVGILVWAVVAVPAYLVLRGIYRGANWARLLQLIVIALAVVLMPQQLARLQEQWKVSLYVAQTVVTVIAVGILFFPQSNRWFSTRGVRAPPSSKK